MGRLVMLKWTCSYCGSENPGPQRECSNCAKPKDENVKYEMPNKIQYVDENKAKHINRNPDWYCSFCDSFNSDDKERCSGCGSLKKDSKDNYFTIKNKKKKSDFSKNNANEKTIDNIDDIPDFPIKKVIDKKDNEEKYNQKSVIDYYYINDTRADRTYKLEKKEELFHETSNIKKTIYNGSINDDEIDEIASTSTFAEDTVIEEVYDDEHIFPIKRVVEKETIDNENFELNENVDDYIVNDKQTCNKFDEEKQEETFFEKTSNAFVSFKEFISHNKQSIFSILGGIAGIALLISLVCLCVSCFKPKIKDVVVTEVTWDYNISIENYLPYIESDWSIPVGGVEISHKQEIHHYVDVLDHYETVVEHKSRKVLDHYETKTETKSRKVVDYYEEYVTGYRDLGNGYAEEITSTRPVYKTEYYTESHQEPVYKTEYYTETHEEPVYRKEPVYQTKYTYEIYRWKFCRDVHTNGYDKNDYWGEVNLAENERESGRKTTYTVTFKTLDEKEKVYTYTINQSEWQEFYVGQELKVKIGVFSYEIITDHE